MSITTSSASSAAIDPAALETYRATRPERTLLPADTGYDDGRRVWNAMVDRRPALIVRCAGVADVIEAVQFARDRHLPISVKGGGHSVAGKAVCDDGVMIDLSPMASVRIDPVRRTARVEGGATWGVFDREAQAFGLATTGGVIPSTGVAGLTLGGGFGFLMRRFGLACDNLLAADVVLANGTFVTTNERDHPDLFWGLRGGSGNFGIVTSFEFQLHPVGPTVLGGFVVHPFAQAHEVCQFYRDFTATTSEVLGTYLGFAVFPDGQPVVAFVVGYTGELDEGEHVLQPLRSFGQPIADTVGPLPYTELQGLFAPSYPAGRLNYWKSNFLSALSDEVIDLLIERFASAPSPFASIGIEHLGGAVARVDSAATAFAERDAPYSLLITPSWDDPADSPKNIQWARSLWDAVQPHARESVYVNYLDAGDEHRVNAAFGANLDRLVQVKTAYDPDNHFRHTHNIRSAQ